MKIKNLLNAHTFPKNCKVFTEPSQTIPDATLSIRQILDRFARGLPVTDGRKVFYDDSETDDFLPDPRTLDLAERQEFAEQAKQELVS